MPARRPAVYGITLWAPSLFVVLLKVTPQEAAKMMVLLSLSGFIGRVSFPSDLSFFCEAIGRRNAGGLLGFGAGVLTIPAGCNYDTTLMGVSSFWLILGVTFFFADGGFASVGPYAAEVWPSHLRTSGMGSADGFGGIGKIIGPRRLALIVGSNNYLKPDVPLRDRTGQSLSAGAARQSARGGTVPRAVPRTSNGIETDPVRGGRVRL